MKKSKKALLWTIVPVLGVSSGVAGAVAGVTNQKTSVDTNNVATPGSATTMAARNTSKAEGLKITSQTKNVLTYSKHSLNASLTMNVSGASSLSNLKYKWEVNKGSGWSTHTSITGRQSIFVDVPKNIEVAETWTFRCTVTDLRTGSSVTSENIKFTITPWVGRYISITEQPTPSKTVSGGEEVTLKTNAKVIGNYVTGKTIGYQWFTYDSENNTFAKIEGANSNTYKFTAPYTTSKETQNYVCKYYFTSEPNKYLSESDQSIITIDKSEKERVSGFIFKLIEMV